jgi:predicted transcriptional regulator
MFSSPTTDLFRHALLAYKKSCKSLSKRIEVMHELGELETACYDHLVRNGTDLKVEELLERLRRMKEEV